MVNKILEKLVRLGIGENQVILRPYTIIWKWLYQIEKIKLMLSLNGLIFDIQHVGSTSIPGMPSKPIIDICLAISNYRASMLCVHQIEKLGYKYKGENDALHQHYFLKGVPISYHLYMVEKGNRILENGVNFREYLKQHTVIANEYITLKKKLARQFATNRKEYQRMKHQLVQQMIENARAKDINFI
jgi:GrpB-like predicted nucleotidyltransferase (UPF0157 family)